MISNCSCGEPALDEHEVWLRAFIALAQGYIGGLSSDDADIRTAARKILSIGADEIVLAYFERLEK